MTFLLDTDTCSAYMRRPGAFAHRFVQYSGRIATSSVNLAELYAGAYKHAQCNRLLTRISDLITDLTILSFDEQCAEDFGKIRGGLLQSGIQVPTTDLMIASVAIVHDLTLVTHNTADYRHVPGLRLDDWLIP